MARSKAHKRSFLVLTFGGFFAYIALWQFVAFAMLLLLVWLNEVLDFAHFLLNLPPRNFSWMHACFGSAGVLLAAIVAIGNTYLQQKQIVHGLLTICTYCNKIQVDTELWQRIEEYISKRSRIFFSHGICPACLAVQMRKIQDDVDPERTC